jgi:hypothetical protein
MYRQETAIKRLEGVLFYASRTRGHRKFSKPEFFQSAVDDLLLFLKQQRVMLANDNLGDTLQFESGISVYEAILAAKRLGVSHVLIFTVDRPISHWAKS